MSNRQWAAFISLLVLVSTILTACGGASATPEPLPTPLPTNYKSIASTGYGFSWSGPGEAAESNDFITFTNKNTVVYVQSWIENTTVENFGDKITFFISVEETERSKGFALEDQPTCKNDDGDTVSNGTETIMYLNENGPYHVTCMLSHGDVVRGFVEFGKLSSAVQTLTALPTSSPTKLPTSTPTIATYTPTVTGTLPTITPSATPTRTLHPTFTNTATSTQPATTTPAPVTTKTITCSNGDQDVTYTVKGPIAGSLSCADGLTRQDEPVRTLVIPGSHGNMNVTLDRVGGPNAMYTTLITYIPGIYGTATSTMTGSSISEGHAEVSTNSNTLIRVLDGEVVSLELEFGDFEVTAQAWLK